MQRTAEDEHITSALPRKQTSDPRGKECIPSRGGRCVKPLMGAQPQRAKPEHEVSGVLAAAFYVSSTRHEWQRVANQPRPPEGEASTPKTPQLRLSWRYAMRLMLSAIAMVIGLAIPTAASAECSGAPDMCIQESSSKIALYDGALRRLGPSLSIVHQAALSCEARCRRIRRQPARSICFCECAGGIPHVFRGRVLCE